MNLLLHEVCKAGGEVFGTGTFLTLQPIPMATAVLERKKQWAAICSDFFLG
jgi:hypothetical protein